jgi:hypothetical protein
MVVLVEMVIATFGERGGEKRERERGRGESVMLRIW